MEQQQPSPWITPEQAAAYAQVSKKAIYLAVKQGRLRAARVNSRRDIRTKFEWVSAWLEATAMPIEVSK